MSHEPWENKRSPLCPSLRGRPGPRPMSLLLRKLPAGSPVPEVARLFLSPAGQWPPPCSFFFSPSLFLFPFLPL